MDHEEHSWEGNEEAHGEIHRRIDDMDKSYSRWMKALSVIMMAGAGTALIVWADTRELVKKEPTHATKGEVAALAEERAKIDRQQNRALNWQTSAIEAIAKKVGAGDDLPVRPRMLEEDRP